MALPPAKPNEKIYTVTADEQGGGHVILTIAVDAVSGVMKMVAVDPAPPQ